MLTRIVIASTVTISIIAIPTLILRTCTKYS